MHMCRVANEHDLRVLGFPFSMPTLSHIKVVIYVLAEVWVVVHTYMYHTYIRYVTISVKVFMLSTSSK